MEASTSFMQWPPNFPAHRFFNTPSEPSLLTFARLGQNPNRSLFHDHNTRLMNTYRLQLGSALISSLPPCASTRACASAPLARWDIGVIGLFAISHIG